MNDRASSLADPAEFEIDLAEMEREERLEQIATTGRGLRRLAATTVLTIDAERAWRRRISRPTSPSAPRVTTTTTSTPAPPSRPQTSEPTLTPPVEAKPTQPARTAGQSKPTPAARAARQSKPTPPARATRPPKPAPKATSKPAITPRDADAPRPTSASKPATTLRDAGAPKPTPTHDEANARAPESDPTPAAPVTAAKLLKARSSHQAKLLRNAEEAERMAADEKRWQAWASSEHDLTDPVGLKILDERRPPGRLALGPIGRKPARRPADRQARREPDQQQEREPTGPSLGRLRARLSSALDHWAERETAVGERLEALVTTRKGSQDREP